MLRSTKSRLALLLFVPIFFFVLTAVTQMNTITSDIKYMNKALYETSYKANDLIVQSDRDMYQALRSYDLLRLAKLDQAKYAEYQKDFDDNMNQIKDRLTEAVGILQKNGMMNMIDPETNKSAADLLGEFQAGTEKWLAEVQSNVQNRTPVDQKQEIAMAEQFENSRSGIDNLSKLISAYAEKETVDLKKRNKSTQTITWTALIIEWLAIIGLGFWLIRHIGRSLHKALNKTQLVASGNLQAVPETKYYKDEFGHLNQAIDTMIASMRQLIGQITENTRIVSASAIELSVSAQESSATTTHVAENIQEVTAQAEIQSTIAEETSRAVEEMSLGVQRIAENTNIIADHSSLASEQVEHGNNHMIGLKNQLEGIFAGIQSLSKTVAQLTDKSEQIGQITENITAFANQTNILSLNASIEAARAGEHGKGFAVVAQEIRKLAAGSLESAEVISALIEETRREIASASSFMSDTLSRTDAGERMLGEVEQDFSAILQAVKQVTVQVHETSAITEQMSASSEEVSASMEQSASSSREVSGMTQTVAAATEEQLALVESMSHAAEQLKDIVDNLKQSVSQFKL